MASHDVRNTSEEQRCSPLDGLVTPDHPLGHSALHSLHFTPLLSPHRSPSQASQPRPEPLSDLCPKPINQFASCSNEVGRYLPELSRNFHLGQMRPAVLLSNNYFLALAFLFGWPVEETYSCDTKWIRLVYMMSCGKKKRESVWTQNNTFYENLPSDFDGALKYFKEKDPNNPMLHDAVLHEILEDEDDSGMINKVPKLLLFNDETKEPSQKTTLRTATSKASKPTSVLLNKLFPKIEKGNHLGIQGFPEQWDIEEILDEKINENHRREINRLIEECCKVPPVTSCNGNTFSGACK